MFACHSKILGLSPKENRGPQIALAYSRLIKYHGLFFELMKSRWITHMIIF
jgi:hypothetical protein